MTNDFQLFDDSGDSGSAVDADIALIVAYLSRELSSVQIAAVQDRLENDVAFREKVQPLIDGWTIPFQGVFITDTAARTMEGHASSLTRAEADAGWDRYLSSTIGGSNKGIPKSILARRVSMARVAAMIALAAIPLFAVALFVRYNAYRGAQGLETGRGTARSSYAAMDQGLYSLVAADGALAPFVNAPLQYLLPATQRQSPQPVQVVDLPAAIARTTHRFAAILGIKHTDEGRVLVNDPLSRQVLLFEPDLATSTTVFDSLPGTSRSYPGGEPDPDNTQAWRILNPFVGDSAVFGQLPGNGVRSYIVLDSRGNVVRTFAVDVRAVGDGVGGTYWDAEGRPVVRLQGPRASREWIATTSPTTISSMMLRPDSLLVLRSSGFTSGRIDTLGAILLPEDRPPRPAGHPLGTYMGLASGGGKHVPVTGPDGVVCWRPSGPPRVPGCTNTAKQVVNPLYTVDDFAVLSDGTVAFVRGNDYHIDWIHPDGTKSASGKLPFEWKRLSDEDKQRLVDSTRAAIDSLDAEAVANEEKRKPWTDSVTQALRASGSRNFDALIYPGPPVRIWPYEIVPLSQIADYYPPIRPNAAKPDADGNLWILPRTTSLSRQGELVYDVVNPTRGMAQRVRIPLGRSIAGFGKGGVVYLQHGDLKNGFVLERTMLPSPIPR